MWQGRNPHKLSHIGDSTWGRHIGLAWLEPTQVKAHREQHLGRHIRLARLEPTQVKPHRGQCLGRHLGIARQEPSQVEAYRGRHMVRHLSSSSKQLAGTKEQATTVRGFITQALGNIINKSLN